MNANGRPRTTASVGIHAAAAESPATHPTASTDSTATTTVRTSAKVVSHQVPSDIGELGLNTRSM